jgi:hypothetical protein
VFVLVEPSLCVCGGKGFRFVGRAQLYVKVEMREQDKRWFWIYVPCEYCDTLKGLGNATSEDDKARADI